MAREVRWGQTPWIIDFHPDPAPTPEILDFAVIGGGFTGLSAAAALRRINPEKTVAVFEAETVGARSSGHTGGLVLGESAAGDLPGLGDVLDGFATVTRELKISCDLSTAGCLGVGPYHPVRNPRLARMLDRLGNPPRRPGSAWRHRRSGQTCQWPLPDCCGTWRSDFGRRARRSNHLRRPADPPRPGTSNTSPTHTYCHQLGIITTERSGKQSRTQINAGAGHRGSFGGPVRCPGCDCG